MRLKTPPSTATLVTNVGKRFLSSSLTGLLAKTRPFTFTKKSELFCAAPQHHKPRKMKNSTYNHIDLELDSEEAVAEFIAQALEEADSGICGQYLRDIRSFEDAGVLSNNTGIVISTSSGQKFTITIVESSSSY